MKDVMLLGASGSIGLQTLEILKQNKDFCLKAVSVGKNIKELERIISEFDIEVASVGDGNSLDYLKLKYPNISFYFGSDGLIKVATYRKGIVINALVGIIGLEPTIEAIKNKSDILLANKETLVTGGDIVNKLVKENNVKLYPIDSEHSAIWQCLEKGKKEDVKELIITASGGAFRDLKREELVDVTIEDALKHPNWSMGAKITIDCATMVNKGLEVIEAHHLFDIPYDNIKTIIHKESIIHSMVCYNDGSIIAQMGLPNMMLPIQYALLYPNHKKSDLLKYLDFNKISSLSFREMDMVRFPMLELAYKVGKVGGLLPTVYNASNEIAVKLFIDGVIKFLDIEKIIIKYVNNYLNLKDISNPTLEEILSLDKTVKENILKEYRK